MSARAACSALDAPFRADSRVAATKSPHYRITTAGVEMLLDDEWIGVPNEVIQYRSLDGDTGETHGGHWCGVTNWKEQDQVPGFEYALPPNHPGLHLSRFFTRCAMLPPGVF